MAEKSRRGFGAMDREKQREIASKGGRAAHQSGHAHEFTPEEAREAGRKGGMRISQDREHMREIGRRGGEESGGGRRGRSSAGRSRGTAEERTTQAEQEPAQERQEPQENQ